MENQPEPQIGDIVYVERDDHTGDIIPFEYRCYIRNNTYIYRAKIIHIMSDRRYNRVQPIPLDDDTSNATSTRKEYDTHVYKVED